MIGGGHNYEVGPSPQQLSRDLSQSPSDRYHLVTILRTLGAYQTNVRTVLDKKPMFSVFSKRDGKPYKHHVKALQIIWNHFPQLSVPVVSHASFGHSHQIQRCRKHDPRR